MFELIDDRDRDRVESSRARPDLSGSTSPVSVSAEQFSVEFSSVTFAYRTRPLDPVIRDLTLSVRPLTLTCLVGPSGSGKSTIGSLLCGLLKPSSGTLRLGGRLLPTRRHATGSGLEDPEKGQGHGAGEGRGEEGERAEAEDLAAFIHRHVGVVEQSSGSLLSGSIRYNISYGKVVCECLLTVRYILT